MSQANDPLFYEIIRSAHGPGPAAGRYYRPFDVGPRVSIKGSAAGARPVAAVAGWIAAAARSVLAHAPRTGASTAAPCCQPA